MLTALRRFPAQEARYADFPDDLDPRLREVLARRGVERLYTHQREAYDAARAGGTRVVVTPTASGKTLCYNLPVLDTILKDPDARALYLFPTKALAQDQLAELYGLIETLGADIGTFTYDGDTPQDARKAIRARAHIVVTNPDMLHKGILPHHTKWVKLFENLRYVVVDELHTHRGVYGSHVANIFRRLHRLCEFYGSQPAVPLLVRDHRQPEGAGGGAHRTRDDAHRRERRPARRALLRDLQPAGGEPPARHPALRARLRARRGPVLPEEGPADDRVRALAPVHGGARHVPQGRAGDAAGLRRRDPRLSRRLSAPEAARDRARPARRAPCSASSPRTRSSSASTSAASTPPCSSAIRAASPPPGSRRGAPGAARARRWRCWWRTRRR